MRFRGLQAAEETTMAEVSDVERELHPPPDLPTIEPALLPVRLNDPPDAG
jgi:hypothetical protein